LVLEGNFLDFFLRFSISFGLWGNGESLIFLPFGIGNGVKIYILDNTHWKIRFHRGFLIRFSPFGEFPLKFYFPQKKRGLGVSASWKK